LKAIVHLSVAIIIEMSEVPAGLFKWEGDFERSYVTLVSFVLVV
jgi:hypothetical protein